MAVRITTCRQSIRISADRRGFTLIELLIAMAVVGIIMALLLPIVLGNRRVVQHDQLRTGVNQTLRAANDILAADVRIAGERLGLGLGLTPIGIAVDANDNSVLTLRRNLAAALPVCKKVNGASIKITDPSGGAQCASRPSLEVHKRLAQEAGGTAPSPPTSTIRAAAWGSGSP